MFLSYNLTSVNSSFFFFSSDFGHTYEINYDFFLFFILQLDDAKR